MNLCSFINETCMFIKNVTSVDPVRLWCVLSVWCPVVLCRFWVFRLVQLTKRCPLHTRSSWENGILTNNQNMQRKRRNENLLKSSRPMRRCRPSNRGDNSAINQVEDRRETSHTEQSYATLCSWDVSKVLLSLVLLCSNAYFHKQIVCRFVRQTLAVVSVFRQVIHVDIRVWIVWLLTFLIFALMEVPCCHFKSGSMVKRSGHNCNSEVLISNNLLAKLFTQPILTMDHRVRAQLRKAATSTILLML